MIEETLLPARFRKVAHFRVFEIAFFKRYGFWSKASKNARS